MPDASWFQNDFSGGEISPDAQGNFDDPMYGKSLALCQNAYVLPTKSVERRQGTRTLGNVTGSIGRKLFALSGNDGSPVVAEFEEIEWDQASNTHYSSGGLYLWAPPNGGSLDGSSDQGGFGAALPSLGWGDPIRSPLVPVCDVYATVSGISSAGNAVFTISGAPSTPWVTGDRVVFYVDDQSPATAAVLRAQIFIVTMLTTTTFTVGVAGSSIINRTSYSKIYAGHQLRFLHPLIEDYAVYSIGTTLPYGIPSGVKTRVNFSDVQNTNVVQTAANKAYFFFPKIMPWVLDFSVPATPTFQDANFNWSDGPWEDPPTGNSQTGNFPLTITANTGATITLAYNGSHYIPEIRGVGQGIRLWTQPPAWASGTAYSVGDSVTYDDAFYVNVIADTGTIPGSANVTTGGYPWLLSPTLGTWSNGFLVAINPTGFTMTFQIVSPQQVPTYTTGGAASNIIEAYQTSFFFMSYYVDTTTKVDFNGRGPSNGAFHQGRLWLAGSGADTVLTYPASLGQPTQFGYSRFDASMANQTNNVGGAIPTLSTSVPVLQLPQFSLTDNNGNVLDDSGITYTLNSDAAETIHWILPDAQGLLLGTNTAEWLVTASALNDPITPTSIQALRQTRFGSEPVYPMGTGLAVIFVQQAGKRVVEYVADVLSQRFTGQPLNDRALHMTSWPSVTYQDGRYVWVDGGVKACAYLREPYPFLWFAMNDGSLANCTYRRLSRFGQEAPVLNAWQSHVLGTNRNTDTLCAIQSTPANVVPVCAFNTPISLTPGSGMLVLGTSVPGDSASRSFIEVMMNPYGPNGILPLAWPLDGAVSGGIDGIAAIQDTTSGVVTTTIYGLALYSGQTLSIFSCGTYVGDYTVASGGTITVAAGTILDSLADWTDALTTDGDFWQFSSTRVAISTNGTVGFDSYYIPMTIGSKFTSIGQTLRPNSAQDTKTPSGPAIAKQRRFNMIGAHVQNALEFNLGLSSEAYTAITYSGVVGGWVEGLVRPTVTFNAIPVVYPSGAAYAGNQDLPLNYDGGTATPSRLQAYNGILWSPIDDTYTFDGMITWQVSDPYPCRVLSLGGFFQTQER